MSELDYCKQRVYHVRDKKTEEIWDCIPEIINRNFSGYMETCFEIGIYNYQGWHMRHRIYDNKEFNEMYEIINY